MISNQDIERIIDLNITDVIGAYITLKKKGINYQACCPLHDEKTPSFVVNPVKGIYKCFGCGKGGNAIGFVMEYEKLTFPEAVKTIAKKHNIDIKETEYTSEEKAADNIREQLIIANEAAQQYFSESLNTNQKAKEYALNRFKPETLQLFGVGYAPDDWHGLHNFSKKIGIKDEMLLKAGLLSESREKVFDFFRDRIIFPIYNRYGRIIAFSGRILTPSETAKYINTPETLLYNKSHTLYGLHLAQKEIRHRDYVYIVEGNTDVMRLHDLNIGNSIGTCGTSLTDEHITQLRRFTTNIVIVFDGDAAGEKATIRGGKMITAAHLNASVIRLPMGEEKTDPDSFFTSEEQFYKYERENSQPFIIWYAQHFNKKHGDSPEGRSKLVSEIAEILSTLPDEVIKETYIHELSKLFKIKEKQLKTAVDKLTSKTSNDSEKTNLIPDFVLLTDYEKYGFYEDNNCYWFKGKGAPYKGSNFIIKPLFHIESVINAKRLFEIVNEFGYSRVIELLQKDMVSLSAFKVRVESLGNFVWLAPETDLNRLKSFIYEKTQTCTEITQLGWQARSHFYAWANGIFNEQFTPVNELGIVSHSEKNYYIPAYSSIYKHEHNLYVSERKFIHHNGEISASDYIKQLINVFDNNALVGFAFYIATLFRDYLVSKFNFFPILNMFGPKGAGKTEMAVSLLQLFGKMPKGPNINSTSKAALADHISQFSNALAHIDEYKNNLEFEKIEFLKGIWDGTGRTRMNMDKDKKKETTAVDVGLMLTGQEMPTADIALFSRLIFITFTKVEYSDEEKEEFNKLKEIERKGLTHITEQILKERSYFKSNFDSSYNQVIDDLNKMLENNTIEDRIFKNWCIVIASYYTMHSKLNMPFSYKDSIKVFYQLLIQQNSETKRGNEISIFWGIVEYLLRDGLIEEDIDFKIDYTTKLDTDKGTFEWNEPRELIYINHARIIPLYRKHGYQMKENVLPVKTLEYYLINDKRYFGRKPSVRFKTNALKDTEEMGATVQRAAFIVTKAMVFDYKLLDINLEMHAVK